MGLIGSWRYKNKVLHITDAVFSPLGPNRSKMVLRVGFWGTGWKKFVRNQYEKGEMPNETAASLVMMCMRNLVGKSLTPDQKAITLHAIKTGNNSDYSANHFIAILDGLRTIANDVTYKAAMYEVIGALEGRDGEELDNYRDGRLLDDILRQKQNWQAELDSQDFWTTR